MTVASVSRAKLAVVTLVALLASASPLAAADVTVKVTLDAIGRGDVFICVTTKPVEIMRLSAERDPQVVSLFLTRLMRGSPAQITDLLRSSGFSSVVVGQKADADGIRTDITAVISDVRPLAVLGGGNLDLVRLPGNDLELSGALGGVLGASNPAPSSLAGADVKLWIVFPGTVREADKRGVVSHAADAVIWRWTADRLVRETTPVRVRVLPRIEGEPRYWLALILGVTALVVVGAAIVLRHGRDAKL